MIRSRGFSSLHALEGGEEGEGEGGSKEGGGREGFILLIFDDDDYDGDGDGDDGDVWCSCSRNYGVKIGWQGERAIS